MKALVVGDGEGRNGAWLAQQGLDVMSVDYSQMGLNKAQALAKSKGVTLHTVHADLTHWSWPINEYDLVVAIFIHFSSDIRLRMHQAMLQALKPGGLLIMEAFTKEQLKFKSGGPPVEDMLFTAKLLRNDFQSADIRLLEETYTTLNEGPFHSGEAAVVRLILKKPE